MKRRPRKSAVTKLPPARALKPAPRRPRAELLRDTFGSSRLERLVAKPRAAWSADDLVRLARELDLKRVSLMHVGGDGWLKVLDFAPRGAAHLRDVLTVGERADGSSLFAGTGIRPEASDVVLQPRLATAFMDPFSVEPALVLLCGHAGRDGLPLAASPDTIVRGAHERLRREAGIDLWAHGEVEFFLGRPAADGDTWGVTERGYHATAPFVFGESLRRSALAALAEIGVALKYGHAEVGYVPATEGDSFIWEQHEVELALAPLPEAADALLLSQWVLRNLAREAGVRCSFEPVVRPGHAGNGLHIHFSPTVGGQPVGGRRSDGTLGDEALWLIAGLVEHGAALMAFGNRVPGSFVRLSQGKETPHAITWGDFDRHALVRLPLVVTTADGRAVSPPTIEFRLPDGSAHPHLLLAGVAQAFLAARESKDPAATVARAAARPGGRAPAAPSPLPRTAAEVARALAAARPALAAGGIFPSELFERTLARLGG